MVVVAVTIQVILDNQAIKVLLVVQVVVVAHRVEVQTLVELAQQVKVIMVVPTDHLYMVSQQVVAVVLVP